MLKFYRKVRQELLSEGKTAKYLKYAIGEIVLVVIGILIALSLNNLKEDFDNRGEEMRILSGLKQEFEVNLAERADVVGFGRGVGEARAPEARCRVRRQRDGAGAEECEIESSTDQDVKVRKRVVDGFGSGDVLGQIIDARTPGQRSVATGQREFKRKLLHVIGFSLIEIIVRHDGQVLEDRRALELCDIGDL